MTTYDFDALTEQDLRARQTVKWNYFGDALAMWVAEMDFPTAPEVMAGIRAAVEREEFGYPRLANGLPEAYAEYALREYGQHVEPAYCQVLPDVLKGVELGIGAYSPPGTPVVLPTPAYMPFWEVPSLVEREILPVPLHQDDAGRYTLNLDGIDAAFKQGGRSIILCQPYNPIGRVFTHDELAALSEVVEANGAFVISDEIHAPLVYAGRTVPYATVSDVAAGHCITITSASKAWNLPGLKAAISLVHTPENHEIWLREVPMKKWHGASTIGIEANIAAFRDGEPWLEACKAYLAANAAWLAETLTDQLPEVRYTPPEGTYFAWLDFSALGLPDDPAAWFRQHAGVVMNNGPAFGPGGQGYARMNLATTRAILTEGVERIVGALARR